MINSNHCYLNFYISSKPWFYILFYHLLVSILVIYSMVLQLQ